jgi:hypothetical protein
MRSHGRTISRLFAFALVCGFAAATMNCTAFVKGLRAGMQDRNHVRKDDPAKAAEPSPGELAKEYIEGSPTDVVEKKAYDMLNTGDFAAIDKMAEQARTKKARLTGGYWELDAIYNGVCDFFAEFKGQRVNDEMWANKIEVLKQWKEKDPNSITARVALSETYINYGFAARGSGYADTVSQQGWKILGQRLDMAEQELRDAQQLRQTCPRWYREVLSVGMYKGWSAEDFDDVFNQAVAYEPNYLQFYLTKSENLTLKWNGERGDWQKFVDALPGKLATLRTDESDIIYMVVLMNKMRESSIAINWAMVSQDRIKHGFEQLEKKYGVDNHRLNQYAFLLSISGQYPDAKPIFERIGDDIDKDVWDQKTFLALKRVAELGRPDIAQVGTTH